MKIALRLNEWALEVLVLVYRKSTRLWMTPYCMERPEQRDVLCAEKCQELGNVLHDFCNGLHPGHRHHTRRPTAHVEDSLLTGAFSSFFPCAGAQLWTLSTSCVRALRVFSTRILSSVTLTSYSVMSLYASKVLLKIGFVDFLHSCYKLH